MPTAVLVHGGFHGGWCWKKVSDLLARDGWQVYAPSLTGMGDRAHLLSRDITFDTWAQDIASLIETHDLRDFVLCGHSAAGCVITKVADQLHDRIRHLVYLDSQVLFDGETFFDSISDSTLGPPVFRELAATGGDGWFIPASALNAEAFGVTDPGDQAWVDARLTPNPILPWEKAVNLSGNIEEVPRTYIRCEQWAFESFDRCITMAEADPAWHAERWDCAHDVMITDPEKVHNLLVRANSGYAGE
ncbi:MAG: alpha/beta fold hydrolase [Nocardioides sp.]|uniref:alpha/beta fold hydrolase n=1 Tax=Nocardioides sp. TaxID=35761 RepID=UPI0039E2A62C